MLISVITCTWNSEAFFDESIASVLAQDHPDIEYIFVDGGSSDDTLERIAAIPRPVKIVRDIQGGISRAMNEGVLAATGEVVAYLHSDDYYLAPDVLSHVADALSDGNSGWAFGRIKRVVDGQLVPESYLAPRYSRRRLLRRNFIPHPATFVRRDWINQVGRFDESLKYAMDYDLWLKLSKIGAPLEFHRALAAFRVHAGSLSSANRLAAMDEDFRVRLAHCGTRSLAALEHRLRHAVRRQRLLNQVSAW